MQPMALHQDSFCIQRQCYLKEKKTNCCRQSRCLQCDKVEAERVPCPRHPHSVSWEGSSGFRKAQEFVPKDELLCNETAWSAMS